MMAQDLNRIAIGIDLGTTFSCVGVYLPDKGVEIICSEDTGNHITPSCVAFTRFERFIGEAAQAQLTMNPTNTVYDTKRLMGQKFISDTVQKDIKRWPFVVRDNGENKPLVEVMYKKKTKRFFPEEISAMILTRLKSDVEAYLGCEVTDAVVTVPAYFDNRQRKATKNSAQIAGFNVLRIMTEPTAAAIAYGLNRKEIGKKNLLVFDWGGGTFDVVILSHTENFLDVVAIGGDSHLGGRDLDNILVDHFVQEIRHKKGKDLTGNHRALQRLRVACEKAKKILSSSNRTTIEIDCLYDGVDYCSTITRARFEKLCSHLFTRTLNLVQQTLGRAKFDKSHIDEVVLVGGSTRIVKIQTLLETFFDGKKLNRDINPDEAVAHGAAVQAAMITGTFPAENKVTHLDVTPHSLGIETSGGRMSTIVQRNTRLPIKVMRRNYTTSRDNQPNMEIKVYQGDGDETKENQLLGTFVLSDIQEAPVCVPSIDITFEVNLDGILNVSAVDRATKSLNHLSISGITGSLRQVDVSRMIEERKILDEDDQRVRECNLARNDLQSYCYSTVATLSNKRLTEGKVNDDDLGRGIDLCNAELQWLEDNDNLNKQEIAEKMKDLGQVCNTILSKISWC